MSLLHVDLQVASNKDSTIIGPLRNHPRDSTGGSESESGGEPSPTLSSPSPPSNQTRYSDALSSLEGGQGDLAATLEKLSLKTVGIEQDFSTLKTLLKENQTDVQAASQRIQNLTSRIESFESSLEDFRINIGPLSGNVGLLNKKFKFIEQTCSTLREEIIDTKIGLSSQLQAFASSTQLSLDEVKEDGSELKGMCSVYDYL